MAPILTLVAVGTVATALTPVLLKDHPLLLVALEARNRNLLATAGRVDLLPFVVVGVTRRVVTDPLYYLLGRCYGEHALRWAERHLGGGDLLIKVTEQGFRRASGAMVFLFPGALVCVLAGVAGMRPWVFLALNVAGTLVTVLALRLFAGLLAGPIDAVLRFNDRNVLWLTVVSALVVVVAVVVQRRRGRGELETLDEIEEELEGGDRSAT